MDYIPKNIQSELARYIQERCSSAESGWEFSNQDEDTITGDFLGNLRTPNWINKNNFEYRFYYNKFRGRGKGALEKSVGADGIITFELIENGEHLYKSFVFQAKKEGNKTGKEQLEKMEYNFPGGNVIFRYGANGYYIENYGNDNMRICEYLYNIFLNCKHGIFGVHYDSDNNEIIWKNKRPIKDGKIKHELLIKVKK
ncbi:hypothetical protein [uncultured Tenacibaculum sp.]|uniref:hypothetical protein n=1 Tax=uncultured Tenacibaculum sp. TaxID=174713 RepID=UPI00260D4082|nr:hypothetical protein [uncultured Tenacibaculum sp.]